MRQTRQSHLQKCLKSLVENITVFLEKKKKKSDNLDANDIKIFLR